MNFALNRMAGLLTHCHALYKLYKAMDFYIGIRWKKIPTLNNAVSCCYGNRVTMPSDRPIRMCHKD